MKKIKLKNADGWNVVQESDAQKHVLEISARTEGGMVVEVRIRHHAGEETEGRVTVNGENVLPISAAEFAKLYNNGTMEIR